MKKKEKSIPKKYSTKQLIFNCFLFILDLFLCNFIIVPCSIGFWLGTAAGYDYLAEKYNLYYFGLILFPIIFIIFHVVQKPIYKFVRDNVASDIVFYIISKLYIYIFSTVGVLVWNNIIWEAVDQSFEFNEYISAGSAIGAFMILRLLKCLPNISGGVGGIGQESTPEDVFLFPSMCSVTFFKKMRASIAGIDRSCQRKNTKIYYWLSIADVIFSSLIIAPLVIACWKGIWAFMDNVLFPNDPIISALFSFGFGFSVQIFFTTFQRILQITFSERITNKYLYFISSRFYTAVFGFASVNYWRGVWIICDQYAGIDSTATGFSFVVAYIGLIGTKTLRNVSASPFAIITDKKQGYFDVPTLFRWTYYWKKNKFLYLLDSIFSVFIVGILVILVWRGTWTLLDQNLYYEDALYSAFASLVLGYVIVFLTFASQPLMKILIRKYHNWKRLVIIDIFVMISFCGTINVWRGMWNLIDLYCDLKSVEYSAILHLGTFMILVLFNSSNTLLVRGVYIDAEENGEDCIEFPCYYFRLLFQEREQKRTLAELNNLHQKEMLMTNNIRKTKIGNPIVKETSFHQNSGIVTTENEVVNPLLINDHKITIIPSKK